MVQKGTSRTKKPVVYEELSDSEEINIMSGDPGDDIDGIDTDDLLGSSDEEIRPKKKVARKSAAKKAKSTPKKTKQTQLNLKKKESPLLWDFEKTKDLAEKYPDNYWKYHADAGHRMIEAINADNELECIPCNMSDQGPITSMTLSSDGSLLATFSNVGSIKIWDIEDNLKLCRKIRDSEETNIDEFYCGKFISENELLAVGGKLKDRHRWSAEDSDNHIIPCPIKIFDIADCKVVATLYGHTEEILCIKALQFNGENYLISTSQDGHIMKWHMGEDWITLLESTKMDDDLTCMAFTVSFLPNTGNKYFIAATDEHLRLYDFENAKLLQTFEDIYSSYCDCGKFVEWLDESVYLNGVNKEDSTGNQHAWFISRGAEMCDVSDGLSSKPNTCTLHKLVYPSNANDKFKLEQVQKYQHTDYHANSWLVKITSNGRYILAPTIYGQIFVFNMLTGQVTAIMKEHQDMEVRDVIFHPYRPLIFSSGDDGFVKVYTYKNSVKNEEMV
ncbi:WD40 repeat-like protein [Backusella circina FSU 941]|nr:WD40 repeat-like protein [Backusella circina FSU 941]